MNTFKRQRGLSMLAWMVIATMAGIFLIVGLKLTPIYLEYYNIISILEQMHKDPALRTADKLQVQKSFEKRLNMDSIKNLTRHDYEIKKVEGKKALMVEFYYEVRTPLFSNLSMVVEFERAVEVTGVEGASE